MTNIKTDLRLSVKFAGLELDNPIIASAGPVTATIKQIEKLSNAGIGAVVTKQMPVFSLIALLTFPLALKAIQGAMKNQDMDKLLPAMSNNVQVVLLTQLLLGIGYILAEVLK